MKTALALFAAVYLVYAVSPVKVQTDSIWSIPVTARILNAHTTQMDAYRPTFARVNHGVYEWEGHAYNFFPLGVSLAALPFVAGFEGLVHAGLRVFPEALEPRVRRWEQHFHAVGDIDFGWYNVTETLIASFYTAAAVAVVYLTARRQVGGAAAVGTALMFAFGTSAWSTASRVLWQHGPSLLAVSAAVYGLHRKTQSPRTLAWMGFAVACAYTFRPTNVLTVLALSAWVLWRMRLRAWPYLLGAAAVALPWCAFNEWTYRTLLPPYYAAGRLEPFTRKFWEAMAGNLVSPARGLLVFSPILLLVGWGVGRKIRRGTLGLEGAVCAAVPLAHWFVISSFPHWWAGHSFGPRFFTDVLPYLMFFVAEPMEALLMEWRARPVRLAVWVLVGGVSVSIHARGAWSWDTHWWNNKPINVDQHPERLWDWRDLQFRRSRGWRGAVNHT